MSLVGVENFMAAILLLIVHDIEHGLRIYAVPALLHAVDPAHICIEAGKKTLGKADARQPSCP